MSMSWLDFKLGFRMLIRYPGLTLVGGLAMAFAIAIGAGVFEFVTQVVRPTLPLHAGDRIVGIHLWHTASSSVEEQASYDFLAWRRELRSVEDLGAFRTFERNLILENVGSGPASVAEISAASFRLARVPPLLGRSLVEADEEAGAPGVLVIGYAVWQGLFGAAPDAVGRTVRLGSAPYTVVGVMPDGFAFPVSQNLWLPLRLNLSDYGRRQGPEIQVFGRLAAGATLDEAQAELTTLGLRATADFPDTHEHLRPQVMPYAQSIVNLPSWASVWLLSINVFVVMLLVLVCGNVALLMFARAATRESEIVMRTALGASRGRIIMQLFAEALVLGSVAAVVGLSAARFGLQRLMDAIQSEFYGGLPFWLDASLSPATVLYAAALTLLSAVIAGVLPALKVTRGMGTRLKEATAGGGGLKFGGIWTAVIVSQVAITVAFPAVAFVTRRAGVQIRALDVGFPANEYLSARLELDREPTPGATRRLPNAERADTHAIFAERFAKTYQELSRRLEADPAVVGVTFANALPRMYHPDRFVEVDEGSAAPSDQRWPGWYRVSTASVEAEFFNVLRTPILSGRGFRSGDLEPGSQAVVVNQSFVTRVFGNRGPLGRQIRYVGSVEWRSGRPTFKEPSAWYEIVGVVRDLGMAPADDDNTGAAGFYLPVAAGGVHPAHVAVHVRGDPAALAPRLRAIASAVDPSLRVYDPIPLDTVSDAELRIITFWFRMLLGVSTIALALALAGIYAVMAFTVARRTREIGIRVALGANRRRVLLAIFRRPLTQVALGVVTGMLLVAGLTLLGSDFTLSLRQVVSVVVYAGLMLGVCLLACVVPTRRALQVEPTEALRADA